MTQSLMSRYLRRPLIRGDHRMRVRDLKRFLDELVVENYDSLDWEITIPEENADGWEFATNIVAYPESQEVYIN